ncbi:MAG: hypothetical protein HY400_06850 [Elusimicrobia bacterium]|nr:hypothetical protein [Elusimicrobiota bacterium]
MEIDFAVLAEAAEAVGGKLYMMGGAVDTILSNQVPVIHPRLSLAVRILLSPGEIDRNHHLEVILLDEDGKKLGQIGTEMLAGRNANVPAGWEQGLLLVFNFINVQFQKFGHYTLDILGNGSSLKNIPFRLMQSVTSGSSMTKH